MVGRGYYALYPLYSLRAILRGISMGGGNGDIDLLARQHTMADSAVGSEPPGCGHTVSSPTIRSEGSGETERGLGRDGAGWVIVRVDGLRIVKG